MGRDLHGTTQNLLENHPSKPNAMSVVGSQRKAATMPVMNPNKENPAADENADLIDVDLAADAFFSIEPDCRRCCWPQQCRWALPATPTILFF